MLKLLKAGYVKSTFGLKGELRVNFLKKFAPSAGDLIYFEKGNVLSGPHSLLSARKHGKGWVIKVTGCTDASQANNFIKYTIGIQNQQLKENALWVDDIIGCAVFTTDGALIGSVKEVLFTGANDVYALNTGDGKEVLIPAIKSVVSEIDIGAKKITINPLKGLLEEESDSSPGSEQP